MNRYKSCSRPRTPGACQPVPRPMPRDCRPEISPPVSAPPAMAYVPLQAWGEVYAPEKALCRGTLFPILDLPFERGGCCR